MKFNYFSVTFWFDIFEDHTELLKVLSIDLKNEFNTFNILNNNTNNLITPVITGINQKQMKNITISKINLQYNMDKVSWETFSKFKENVLKLFEILTVNGIEVLHSAIFINAEMIDEDALKSITKNTVSQKIFNDDLVDITLKLGKKHEDLFYKIITLLNKKQIKLPQRLDKKGNVVPIPLISWNGSLVENEIIDISYEINDKYSFDFAKNYHTSEFYLNKMLYILENDIQNDIEKLIKNGEF